MRTPLLLLSLALATGCTVESTTDAAAPSEASAPAPQPTTKPVDPMYEIPLKTLDGKPTTLDAQRGKALLVVNVASECGLTPQYKDLQKLHETYADRGFEVIGFPCNQFGGQEPGTPEQIQAFCETTYNVTFPLMSKIDVNGKQRHPLYAKLTAVPDAKGEGGDVQWNFEKFLVHPGGTKIERFRPKTTPNDPTLVAAIEAALPE